MKKTVLVCLAVFCASALASPAWASGAGIRAGFSLAKIHETGSMLAFQWDGLPFVTGGLFFESGLGFVSLVPEILYVQQGGKLDIDAANGFKDRYHYIQVPIQLKIDVVPAGMVRPFVAGGVYGAYLIRAEAVDKVEGVTIKTNITPDFDRWDAGLVGSAGLAFKLPVMSVSIEARYNHGLMNILKDPPAGSSIKNRCWMALVGIRY
jgi:hypothetical protein